jgi:hypothetical protein
MKTHLHLSHRIAGLGLALAITALIATPLSGMAQERGAAQKLTKIETLQDLQNVNAGDTIVMTCPKCQEAYTQVVEKSFKGSKPEEIKTVPVHLCSECDTKIVHEGVGKQAKDVLVHTCKMCGSHDVACYVIKKGDAAPHDMGNMK